MRKIYTLLLSLVATMVAWAQSPDPSTWEVDQNVARELGMGDCDQTEPWTMKSNGDSSGKTKGDYGQYWKGVGQEWFYDFTQDGDAMNDGRQGYSCVGFYADGSCKATAPNLYQVIKIPAGYYIVRFQGIYRDRSGQNLGELYNDWLKGKTQNYAYAHVTTYASQEDAEAGTSPLLTYKKAVKPIVATDQTTSLCDWTPNGDSWRNDNNYERLVQTDEWDDIDEDWIYEKQTVYYPASIIGAAQHYLNNNYWHEFGILMEEETWVRIGFYEVEPKVTESWSSFGSWEIIYKGEPDDDTKLDFTETQFKSYDETLAEWQKKFADATFDGFDAAFNKAIADNISDYRQQMEFAVNDTYDLQERKGYLDDMEDKIVMYEKLYKEGLELLSYILVRSNDLLASTDYSGKSAYSSKISAMLAKLKAPAFGEDTPDVYVDNCFNELVVARGEYLDTQAADENGAKDFSTVINYPWFVNNGVMTEVKSEEDGTKSWVIDDPTWSEAGNDTYANLKADRNEIASDVSIIVNSLTVQNEWYERQNMTGKSNGLSIRHQDGYMCVQDNWHGGLFESGSMDVCQNILGLPSGYYSLKAYVYANGDGNGNFHNIFMENSDGEIQTSPVMAKEAAWVEATTGIIYVKDQKLTIGGQTDYATGSFTGFRLLFYGTNPPIEKLIKQEIAAVTEEKAALKFKGDINYVDGQIALCKLDALSMDNFDEYRKYLNDARNYIKAAVKAYDTQKTGDTYAQILTDNGSVEGVDAIVAMPMTAADDLGKAETDTYKDIDAVNKLAEKYAEYINVYAEAAEFAKSDADLKTTLDGQKEYLSANVADEATLDKYMANLATPININKMKELGADKATAAAPADLTSLLVNPSFDKRLVDGAWVENDCEWQRGYADGWKGMGINTYDQTMELSRNCCELWNSGTGEFYQEIVGMPAGKYRISCLAVYRDEDITEESVATFEAAGNEENWEGHNNAQIYAKTQSDEAFSYIKAQAGLKGTDDSFNDVVRAYEVIDEEADPKEYYATKVTVLAPEGEGHNDVKYPYVTDQDGWTNVDPDAEDRTPFDKIINGAYYPNSLYGIKQWFLNSPAKVTNTVEIEVKSGETLRLGLRKPTSASNDCLTFDDFKIEYLSGDTFKDILTGIEDVTIEEPVQNVLYNTAGQIVDSSYKGIVINSEGKKFYQNK